MQVSYIYTIVTFAIEKYHSRLTSVVIAANDEMVAQVSIVSGDVSIDVLSMYCVFPSAFGKL